MKAIIIAGLCLLLSACSALKTTKNVYNDYINPSPKVEIDSTVLSKRPDFVFSEAVMPVDSQLVSLTEDFSAWDQYPRPGSLVRLRQKYNWVESLFTINKQGEVLEKFPETSLKPVDTSIFLQIKKPESRKVRMLWRQTDLGPDMYLLYPFFQDNIWKGFKVAQFAPSSWIMQSDKASYMALLRKDKSLFAGEKIKNIDSYILSSILEKDELYGELENTGSKYYWMHRNVGEMWFTYIFKLPVSSTSS